MNETHVSIFIQFSVIQVNNGNIAKKYNFENVFVTLDSLYFKTDHTPYTKNKFTSHYKCILHLLYEHFLYKVCQNNGCNTTTILVLD